MSVGKCAGMRSIKSINTSPEEVEQHLVDASFHAGMSPRKPFECDSDAAAEIMLLVDGSWSIGRTNFRRVRDFLEGLVTPFNIGPEHIQIGERQTRTLKH